MLKRKHVKPHRQLTWKLVLFLTGVISSIMGTELWFYTDSVIQGHEQLLQNPNLTQQEIYAYEGSLQWWRIARITTYDPISLALIAGGILIAISSLLYAIYELRFKKT